MVIIDFIPDEYNRSGKEFEKLDIKTEEDFNNNMYLFAPQPNMKLKFANNMPWFKEYLVYLNDNLVEPQENEYIFTLKTGINILKVFATNQVGAKGIPTIIKIKNN